MFYILFYQIVSGGPSRSYYECGADLADFLEIFSTSFENQPEPFKQKGKLKLFAKFIFGYEYDLLLTKKHDNPLVVLAATRRMISLHLDNAEDFIGVIDDHSVVLVSDTGSLLVSRDDVDREFRKGAVRIFFHKNKSDDEKLTEILWEYMNNRANLQYIAQRRIDRDFGLCTRVSMKTGIKLSDRNQCKKAASEVHNYLQNIRQCLPLGNEMDNLLFKAVKIVLLNEAEDIKSIRDMYDIFITDPPENSENFTDLKKLHNHLKDLLEKKMGTLIRPKIESGYGGNKYPLKEVPAYYSLAMRFLNVILSHQRDRMQNLALAFMKAVLGYSTASFGGHPMRNYFQGTFRTDCSRESLESSEEWMHRVCGLIQDQIRHYIKSYWPEEIRGDPIEPFVLHF